MNNPSVSLVIPAYNEEKYIGACLDSVFKNDPERFLEITVVDNASSDRTSEIALQYKGVRVVQEKTKGVQHARQRGFKESTGDIIAFIDADTRMPKGWHEKIIKEFERNPKLVTLSGPYRYYDISPLRKVVVEMFYAVSMPVYLLFGYMAIFGNFAIRRDILEKMGGLDTTIVFWGDDTNTVRRAHAFGKTKFSMNFFIYTSGRRLSQEGILKTGWRYATNFFSEIFLKKTPTEEYRSLR